MAKQDRRIRWKAGVPYGEYGFESLPHQSVNVFRCSPENRTSFGVRWLINAVPCEEKTRFPFRILQSFRIGSEIAGDLASIEIRNNGAYGNKVYLPAFTEKTKQRLASSSSGRVVRRMLWEHDDGRSNRSY